MKRIIVLFLCAVMTMSASAQEILFPTRVGAVKVYVQKNAKGKVESYVKQTIQKVEGAGDNLTVYCLSEALDKKQQPLKQPVEIQSKLTVRNGVLILDWTDVIGASQALAQIGLEITGTPVQIPANLQAGQSLADANMAMDAGFVKTTMQITDHKCEAIEEVTVEAGTFKSYKLSRICNSSVMGIKTTIRTISWYAPGIGEVKTENYFAKNDKLQNSSELVSIN